MSRRKRVRELRRARKGPPPLAQYFVSRGWLHLLFMTGMFILSAPVLWMAATMLKPDEELTNGRWLPTMPRFVAQSPYVREAPEPVKPLGIDAATFANFVPMLQAQTRTGVEAATRDAGVSPEHLAATTALLLNRLTSRLPTKLWAGDEGPLREAYAALLTPEAIREALADRLARLEIRGLLFR